MSWVKVFKAMEYQALYVVSGRDEFQAHKHLYSYNLRVYLTNGSDANHGVFTLRKSKKMTLGVHTTLAPLSSPLSNTFFSVHIGMRLLKRWECQRTTHESSNIKRQNYCKELSS